MRPGLAGSRFKVQKSVELRSTALAYWGNLWVTQKIYYRSYILVGGPQAALR